MALVATESKAFPNVNILINYSNLGDNYVSRFARSQTITSSKYSRMKIWALKVEEYV